MKAVVEREPVVAAEMKPQQVLAAFALNFRGRVEPGPERECGGLPVTANRLMNMDGPGVREDVTALGEWIGLVNVA